ncbi:hypothetical protein JOC55_000388 [Paenibacillus sacheonensis]|nr:hypothetical protein [Paenibacillus sacheonensis]
MERTFQAAAADREGPLGVLRVMDERTKLRPIAQLSI